MLFSDVLKVCPCAGIPFALAGFRDILPEVFDVAADEVQKWGEVFLQLIGRVEGGFHSGPGGNELQDGVALFGIDPGNGGIGTLQVVVVVFPQEADGLAVREAGPDEDAVFIERELFRESNLVTIDEFATDQFVEDIGSQSASDFRTGFFRAFVACFAPVDGSLVEVRWGFEFQSKPTDNHVGTVLTGGLEHGFHHVRVNRVVGIYEGDVFSSSLGDSQITCFGGAFVSALKNGDTGILVLPFA